jgi:hypothetical protein
MGSTSNSHFKMQCPLENSQQTENCRDNSFGHGEKRFQDQQKAVGTVIPWKNSLYDLN